MRSTARSAPPDSPGPAVLLTNAEERSVLAACRDLSRAGYRVGGASDTVLAPTQWSRCCDWRVRICDPRRDVARFVEQLGAELLRRPYALLLPGSDSALLAISRERERLPANARVGLPPHPVVERVLSREQLDAAARSAGFAQVTGVRCAGVTEALDAARELGYPVALKSAEAALTEEGAIRGAAKGRLVRDDRELRHDAAAFAGELLIQPFLAGEPVSFAGVIAGGELLAAAMTRYLRMWPAMGGSVAFGETIAAPQALEQRVRDLLVALQWEGIFELEFIHTGAAADRAPAAERFVPIDLNPRPYGSMALASGAGAPLAAIWCDRLLGREARGRAAVAATTAVAEPVRARAGLRYRWEDGDARNLAWELRRGRLGAAFDAARPRRDVVHAHLRSDDPAPLLARIAYLGKRALAQARDAAAPKARRS